MEHFEATGLLPCLEARGFEVKTGARFVRDGVVCLFDFSQKHSKGWDWTWQVPRAEFDKVLIDEVASRGVPVDFGQAVVEVVSVSYTHLRAHATVLDLVCRLLLEKKK